MKSIPLAFALGVLVAVSSAPLSTFAADRDGVALAIVFDTSGSMNEPVADKDGKQSPKYVIAARALEGIAARIQTFATNKVAGGTGEARAVYAGLYVFSGDGVRPEIPFGPFNQTTFQNFARRFSNPSGSTPLGRALTEASTTVLSSGLTRKHVLIITDGNNTSGPTPASVFPGLKKQAEAKQTGLSVHFVAFDVDAKVFSGVKKLGATVVGASDEKQLNEQLEFILEKKILLEDEEPPKQK